MKEKMKCELETEKVTIDFSGNEFEITADLPISVMRKLAGAQKAIENDSEKAIDFIIEALKDFLYICNEKEKSEKWVESLSYKALMKAFAFINNYIMAEINDKSYEEKKTV